MTWVTDEIAKLFELHQAGAITREQFEEQRDQLLAESRARVSTPPTGHPSTSTSAPTDTSDLTGQRIGEYRLERKLGEGGMGQVYLGAHETLDQQVAVKVLDPALARSEDVRTRFIQEANIQIQLQHPGIVRVLTAHTQGEHLALVMEYVEGLSLEQALERHGRLPLDRMLPLMTQVLDAVGYAHEQGVVHRDLKPSNIMVQPDGTAKVMDFGIAKVVGGAKLTRTGTLMGTAFYMSPEQVLGRSDIDHRTDIYSLGVTFFEALTGRVPFEGKGDENTDSDYLIKDAHVKRDPPDPREVRPDLPEYVALALLRALKKEPGNRFQKCGEFSGAIGRAGEAIRPVGQPAPAVPLVAPSIPSARGEPKPRSRRTVPVPTGGVALRPNRPCVNVRGYQMVRIDPGEFWMGSPQGEKGLYDETRHWVRLTKAFSIGSTPVTQSLWESVLRSNPSHSKGLRRPVDSVSWYDAAEFCNRLSELEGLAPAYRINIQEEGWWILKRTSRDISWNRNADGFRLPTEAEWEYAARSGDEQTYSGSDDIEDVGWYVANSHVKTHDVGLRHANAWGLFDMTGNVCEWVWDCTGEYPTGEVTDPTGPDTSTGRVVRGGSWIDSPEHSRVASRASFAPDVHRIFVGFRIARSLL